MPNLECLAPMDNLSFIRPPLAIRHFDADAFCGAEVGRDAFGNRYYRGRSTPKACAKNAGWSMQATPEASKVPPEWHIWLHHTTSEPLPEDSSFRKPWQKPYQPNMTGTSKAYLPPGHTLEGGKAPRRPVITKLGSRKNNGEGIALWDAAFSRRF